MKHTFAQSDQLIIHGIIIVNEAGQNVDPDVSSRLAGKTKKQKKKERVKS